VLEGEIGDVTEADFQVLLANLHGDLLLSVGPELVRRARPGAALILSGILWEHNWDVRRLFGGLGCQVRQNLFLDEYSTLLLRSQEIQEAAR
jgi:ribosomal protein L11 methyltransferase